MICMKKSPMPVHITTSHVVIMSRWSACTHPIHDAHEQVYADTHNQYVYDAHMHVCVGACTPVMHAYMDTLTILYLPEKHVESCVDAIKVNISN